MEKNEHTAAEGRISPTHEQQREQMHKENKIKR